ncbi:NADH:flavin oxidoreductase [Gammaproteobacteria bacterium LSUCC0057]|uniref:NADH:flavin oxidoreductase n=1 Tax=Gammaproteobacteria bacterium LSUCC0057 TaxID=2559237 RepID=A0A4Y8UN65_9GAMM|nr:NADH:flavin oxidoreductase [Gammaproteobacteria bacterium LSUCC0057]
MSNSAALLRPFVSDKLSLRNRIVMAPMTRTASPGNVPHAGNIEYYRRRAAGGVGLIVTEGTCVGHKAANGYPNVPYFYGDQALAGWAKVVEAVHAEGGKIAPQLWHVGAIRRAGTEGPQPELPGYSPSGMAVPGKVTGHAMTVEDIQETVAAFVQAALDAQRLGFDAVEIHAAHGYLIDQFFWPGTNHRDDNYGGSMANRQRIAVEIVEGIRAACGEQLPIILRFSQWKQQDYSARLCETAEQLDAFLQPLVAAGVDIFHCSTRRFWQPEFDGSDLNLAGWTRKLTGKPAITVGSVSLNSDFLPEDGTANFKSGHAASIDNLVERMQADEFDLVAVGRALIANPDWVNHLTAGTLDQLAPYSAELLQSLD